MENRGIYTTGEVASICNITVKTLLHYDKIGLIKPEYVDPDNNRRYYSKLQLFHIDIIRRLKTLNFSLKDIMKMSPDMDIQSLIKMFRGKRDDNFIQIEKLLNINEDIQNSIDLLKWMDSSEYKNYEEDKITLKEIPDRKVVFQREKSAFDLETGFLRLKKFMKLVKQNDLKPHKWYMITLHEDINDLNPENTDYEICRLVNTENDNPDFIKIIKGGKFASIVHRGDYNSILKTNSRLEEWIKENGYKICGDTIHVFIMGYTVVTSPDQLVIEIQTPICKK